MIERVRAEARQLARRAARTLPPIRRLTDHRDALQSEVDAMRAELNAHLASDQDLRSTSQQEPGFPIRIEYAVEPRVRNWAGTAGGDDLAALIDAGSERYLSLLADAATTAGELASLTVEAPAVLAQPHWDNGWLPPIDGIVLSHLIATQRPRTYLEIGSGNSTKFARHTIQLHDLSTRIISIDPQPRAEVDGICDRVIRSGLESDETLSAFRELEPGDVVFFDGSHYCFQNSDVTAFFVELIAEIPSRCAYGVHDIFLPDDYPEAWLERFYNEQYVLAAWLLGGAAGDEVLLPAWYVSSRDHYQAAIAKLIAASHAGPERHGGAFWMRRA